MIATFPTSSCGGSPIWLQTKIPEKDVVDLAWFDSKGPL
jgi:hypothetical protein